MSQAGVRVVDVLSRVLPWILIAVLVFNMSQRRFMAVGVGKRFATLQLAGLIAVLWAATLTCRHFSLPDVILVPVAAALVVLAVARRRSMFPHRIRCSSCGTRLPIVRVLYHDDTRCVSCADTQESGKEQT